MVLNRGVASRLGAHPTPRVHNIPAPRRCGAVAGRRPADTIVDMPPTDDDHWQRLAIEGHKRELVDIADVLGVPLWPLPATVSPGLTVAYLPDDMAWPEIHLSMLKFNWHIRALDGPGSCCASWSYPGNGHDSFLTALHHLRLWGGDPTGEPTGWTERHGTLHVPYNWRRQPGLRLDQLDADAFQPAGPR